jgi:septal ring-binding cell division protein DamX
MRDVHAALLCVVAAGCSYDWALPAGGPADAAPQDTSLADTGTEGAGPTDAATEAPGDAASMADAAEAASLPACTPADEATVQQARAAALDCTGVTPNPCEVLVHDQCGCAVYVATYNTAEGQYVAAVQMLLKTCIPSCPTGCSTASEGICVLSDAGSAMLACYQ